MQGTESAEAQAAGEARADASGATAYLNLESGDCHGDDSAVRSLLQSGVSRAVIGEFCLVTLVQFGAAHERCWGCPPVFFLRLRHCERRQL